MTRMPDNRKDCLTFLDWKFLDETSLDRTLFIKTLHNIVYHNDGKIYATIIVKRVVFQTVFTKEINLSYF